MQDYCHNLELIFWLYLWGIETFSCSCYFPTPAGDFDSTYEELKQGLPKIDAYKQADFDSTYEELKLGIIDSICFFSLKYFDSTYEELKL